jgi:hypothetical protein
MNQILLAILIAMTVTQVLVVLPLIDNWMIAKAQNTITPENKTSQEPAVKMIIKDNTVTVINTTSNETISIRNLTEDTGNATTNETITADTGNATTNETITADTGNATTNETITADTGNATTNETLTEKFKALQNE